MEERGRREVTDGGKGEERGNRWRKRGRSGVTDGGKGEDRGNRWRKGGGER
jgi:hypothetical protein